MKLTAAIVGIMAFFGAATAAHAKPLFKLDYNCSGRDTVLESGGEANFTTHGSIPLLYQEETPFGDKIFQQIMAGGDSTFTQIGTTPRGYPIYISFYAHRLLNVRPGNPVDLSAQLKTDLHVPLLKVAMVPFTDQSFARLVGGIHPDPQSDQIDQGVRLRIGEPLAVTVNQIYSNTGMFSDQPFLTCTLKVSQL